MPTKTFFRLRDEKQELILRAAIGEFVKNGYSRAKVNDIAQKAGIAKGSVFQYFRDKKELFTYCAQWGLDVFMKKIDSQAPMDDMDVFDYLTDSRPKTAVVGEERELAAFMNVVMNEPGLLDDSMKSMHDIGKNYTKKLIENGQRKGTVRSDVDIDLLYEFFTGITDRFNMRLVNVYKINFSEGLTEETLKIINTERDQVLILLRNGMGV